MHIKGALAANNTVAAKVENTGTGFAGVDLATDGTDWSILAWGSGTATPNQLSFYNGSTHPLAILSDGTLNLISAKFKINGSAGSSGQTLTTDGSGNISWSSAGSGTISGSGTDNYIPRWNGTAALQDSSMIALDDGRVGVGVAGPSAIFHVKKTDSSAYWLGKFEADGTTQNALVCSTDTTSGVGVRFDMGGGSGTFTVLNSGKVGIGTTAPAQKLEVNGGSSAVQLQFKETSSGYHRVGLKKDGSKFHIGEPSNDGTTSFTEILTVDMNGDNVGIGTATPGSYDSRAERLVVHESGDGGVTIATGATSDGRLVFARSGDTGLDHGEISYDQNTDYMGFATAGSRRVTIDNSGKVGIGTTAPGDFHSAGSRLVIGNGVSNQGITLYAASDAASQINFADGSSGNASYRGIVSYDHSADKMNISTAATIRMSIDSGGRVGINKTPNSAVTLSVNAPASNTTNYGLEICNASANTRFLVDGVGNTSFYGSDNSLSARVTSDGKVGIGTNAPGAALDVRTTTVGGGIFDIQEAATAITSGYKALSLSNSNATVGNHTAINFSDTVGGSSTAIISAKCNDHTNNYGDLQFWTRGATGYGTRLHIDQEGSVGIGTTAPNAILDISDATNDNLRIGTRGGNMNLFSVTDAGAGAPLAFEGTEFHFVTGKVGIGVTDPDQALEIGAAGKLKLSRADNSRSMLLYTDNSDGTIETDVDPILIKSAHRIRFSTNGANERMRITETGLVGIGTTAPSRLFNVYSGSDDTAWIRATYGTTTMCEIGAHSAAAYLQSGTGDDIRISPAGSTKLIIKVDGKIGIGTIAPDNILHVYSSASAMIKLQSAAGNNDIGIDFYRGTDLKWEIRNNGNDDSLFFIPQGQNDADTKLAIKSDGNVGIGTTSPEAALTVAGPNYTHAVFRTNQSTASQRAGGGFSSLGHATATSRFARLFLDADGANFSGTDYFTIEKFGNSGEVKFLQYSNANMSFWVNTTTQAMTIQQDGNVGIGTTAPGAKLHVYGGNIRISSTDDKPQLEFFETAAARWVIGHSTAPNNYFAISEGSDVAASERLVIAPTTGKVGIGITAPTAFLHVYGSEASQWAAYFENVSSQSWGLLVRGGADSADYSFLVRDYNQNDLFTIRGNGNVGIGTNGPDAPLHVARASDYKVIKLGDDITSHYVMTGNSDHTLTLTCGSYYQAEIVITANQTNGGTYNNLYIRGIWSNNHTSHHWDEIENVGNLSSSTFTITNGQNGATTNSGEWKIVHDYVSGSFAGMTVRITDFYGTHAYTIS